MLWRLTLTFNVVIKPVLDCPKKRPGRSPHDGMGWDVGHHPHCLSYRGLIPVLYCELSGLIHGLAKRTRNKENFCWTYFPNNVFPPHLWLGGSLEQSLVWLQGRMWCHLEGCQVLLSKEPDRLAVFFLKNSVILIHQSHSFLLFQSGSGSRKEIPGSQPWVGKGIVLN